MRAPRTRFSAVIPRLAALALFGAMIEPHIELPAYLVLFVLVPKSRVTIVLIGVCALAISVAATGPAIAWEYFARELPLQALAEARNIDQYSLTSVLVLLGASDEVAVRLGELQYAVFAVGSIFVARALRARFEDDALLVAVPATAAMIGGPFIYYIELVAVWPLALLLAHHATGRGRLVAAAALALLTFPWQAGVSWRLDLAAFAIAAVLAWAVLDRFESRRRLAVSIAIAFPLLAFYVLVHRLPVKNLIVLPNTSQAFIAAAPWGRDLAPIPWGVHIRTDHNVLTSTVLLRKLPTLAMFALLLALALAPARFSSPPLPSSA